MRVIRSEKKAHALALLVAGYTVREAAQLSGVSRSATGRLRANLAGELRQMPEGLGSKFEEHFNVETAAIHNRLRDLTAPEYIQSLSASHVASLIESTSKKLCRLLEIAECIPASFSGLGA